MNQYERFSNVTQAYLNNFERILNNMIRQIDHARMTNSISRNFINQMIPHHEAAIAMSKNILRYTTDLELQCLAQTIIRQQTQGIAIMRQMAGRCGMHTNCLDDLTRYQDKMNCILHDMFDGMKGVQSVNDVNENFLREMIPHHLGAVAMSENALRFSICSQLIPVLQNIIDTQKREVEQMRRMLGDTCNCDHNCTRNQGCGCNRDCSHDDNRNCGCDRSRDDDLDCGCDRSRDDDRDCGCDRSRDDNRDCGCNRSRDDNRDCGCDRSRDDDRDCGCNRSRDDDCDCGCGCRRD